MILSSRVARHMSLAGMQYWIAGAESARRDDYLTRAKCASNTGVRARYVLLVVLGIVALLARRNEP